MMPKTLLCTAAIGLATAAFAQDDIPKSGSLVPVVRQQTDSRIFSSTPVVYALGQQRDKDNLKAFFLTGSYMRFRKNQYYSLAASGWTFTNDGGGFSFGAGASVGSGTNSHGVYEISVEGLARFQVPRFLKIPRSTTTTFLDARGSTYFNKGDVGHDGTIELYLSLDKDLDQASSGRFIGQGETWWFANVSQVGFDGESGYGFYAYRVGFKQSVGLREFDGVLVPAYVYSIQGSLGPEKYLANDLSASLTFSLKKDLYLGVTGSTQGRFAVSVTFAK